MVDSISAILAISSSKKPRNRYPEDDKIPTRIRKTLQGFEWVPSQIGLVENEIADQLSEKDTTAKKQKQIYYECLVSQNKD